MRNLFLVPLLAITLIVCACSPVTPHMPTETKQPVIQKPRVVSTVLPAPVKASGHISRQEALAKIKKGAVVFDARTDEEFQKSHYANAINIPVDLLEPTLPALESYKQKEIIVYCASGKRAERLKQGLTKAGFEKVYNVGGLSDLLGN